MVFRDLKAFYSLENLAKNLKNSAKFNYHLPKILFIKLLRILIKSNIIIGVLKPPPPPPLLDMHTPPEQ